MRTVNATCIGALLLAFASGAYASIDAGRVQFVHGNSRALGADGAERALKKGDPVYEGETVITGPSASLQLRMVDDAMIAVRPNSRLQIEVYRLDGKTAGEGHGLLRLISGTFRSITGLIGHTQKANYKIITDTANIGIRGTDHEPGYLLPSQAAAGAPGTYDMVNTGGTYIATPWGRVDVSPNEVGFASSKPGSIPVLLEGVPGFLRATPPMGQDADASGSGQPERIVGLGFDNPASLEQPWLNSLALSYLTDPPVVTTDLTMSDAAAVTSFPEAGVYGDLTTTVAAGTVARSGAFSANVVPAEQFFAGTAGALAATDPNSKLIYVRGPAPLVQNGSGTLADGTVVNWGIYGTGKALNGETIKDQYSPAPGRNPDYMQAMGALATPSAVVSTLSGTYSTMVTSTPIISSAGTIGGQVDSASIVLANGSLTSYQVAATDGGGGSWSASCTTACASPVPLAKFAASGIQLSGSGPAGSASGQANGQAVGPTGQGIISSFGLKDSSTAITGSFAVQK
jgi:FecR protein